MNRNCYRIIFNQTRGLLMAVAENIASQSSNDSSGAAAPVASLTPSPRARTLHLSDLRPLALAAHLVCGTLLALLLPASAYAQIFADPSAPANQRPTVLSASNGTPVVNIQTPNAAGLSHNTYKQLDGGNIVFNNSRTDTQSQLAGWVQGNPWLATGTARTILNEVNSNNPSYLNGALEVAGDRAQLIIANPSGITCTGCSFINANGATLTTGTPIINGGNLESYLVTRGTITINSATANGPGLDTSQTPYTDLMARAVVVNAGIWANQLKVTTGANQIAADHSSSPPIAGSGPVPAFAIDVAQLGGMYAGKITLVGSETGLGVRNAGQIGASAGEVIVTADGRLENIGSLNASSHIAVNASSGIDNSGTIYAQGNTQLASAGDISNTGVIAAQGDASLTASGSNSRISSSQSALLAASLLADANGNYTLAGNGALSLIATQAISALGQNFAGGNLNFSGSAVDLSGSQTHAANIALSAGQGDVSTASANIYATGLFSVHANTGNTQKLYNRLGNIAVGQLDLTLANLDNTDGSIAQTGNGDTVIALSASNSLFDNTRGYFGGNSQNLSVAATTFTNIDGRIEHAGVGAFDIVAPSFGNLRGALLSSGAFSLTANTAMLDSGALQAARFDIVTDTLSNRSGALLQTGSNAGSITATTSLDNTGGSISIGGKLTLNAGSLNNTQGAISAGQDIQAIITHALANNSGTLVAAHALDVQADSLDNSSGVLQATQSDARFTLGGGFNNTLGNVYAGGNLGITAASLSNSGSVYALGDSSIALSGALTNSGILATLGNATITAQRLDASAASLLGAGLQALPDGSFSLAHSGNLSVATTQSLNAYGQNIAAGDLSFGGSAIDLAGSQTSAAANLTLRTTQGDLSTANASINAAGNFTADVVGTLNNAGGALAAYNDVTITAHTLSGIGTIDAGRDATITLASDYTNAAGNHIGVNRDLTLSTSGAFTNQTDLLAVRKLTLNANTIDNQSNMRIEAADTRVTASTSLNNAGFIGGDTLDISAPTLSNSASIMGGDVTLHANALTNQGSNAVIAATGALNLWVQNSVRNLGGAMLYSLGDINIGAQPLLDSNGYLVPGLVSVLNQSSTVEAGGVLRISADQIVNQRTVLDIAWSASRNGPFVNFDVPGTNNDLHYTPSYITEYVTANTTAAARMASGSDMWLGGNISNEHSAIASGANLYYNASKLSQTSRALMETETRSGTQDNWQFVVVGKDCNDLGFSCDPVWGWRNFPQPYSAQTTYQIGSVNATLTAQQTLTGTSLTFLNQTVTGSSGTVGDGSTTRIDAGTHASVAPSLPPTVHGQTVGSADAPLPNFALPNSGLFTPNPDPSSQVLIETDPRFANYRQWQSSDYMLQKLNEEPATAQKRLGDGFYEQKLVREQIAELTGHRFLDSYSDDEAQYLALMDRGITVAQAWNLRPGVALSSAQMASLTSDIVWLVAQDVTLANGSTQSVLVPVVYLSQIHADDLQPSGALIAAADINLQVAGALQNSGSIKSNTSTVLAAADILNRGGKIASGGSTFLQASNDILNQSGTISGQNIALSAGRDIVNERLSDTYQRGAVSATRVQGQASINASGNLQAQAGRDLIIMAANVASGGDATLTAARNLTIAALATKNSTRNGSGGNSQTINLTSQVQSGGNIALTAGQDATLQGAQLASAQNTQLVAGGNINIAAVKDSSLSNFNSRSNTNRRFDETVVGSQIQAGGQIDIAAINLNALPPTAAGRGNIALEGSKLNANGAVNISADNSLTVKEVNEVHEFSQELRSKKSGFLSSTKTTTRTTNNHTDAIGSSIEGDTVNVQVGKDLTVRGSNIVSDQGTTLSAQNDIAIQAATNTSQQSQFTQTRTSGMFSGGSIGFTVGTQQQSNNQQGTERTASASTIGSTQGNVSITAGNTYQQIGSNVAAPVGDIDISAKQIEIKEAQNTSQNSQETKFRQSGLTLAITSPIISAIQTAQQMKQASSQTQDPRMKALAAGTTALAGKSAYDAVGNGGSPLQQVGGINLNISIGASQSSSKTTQSSSTAVGSTVIAGNDIRITATGAGDDSNLTVQGSQIKAGNDARLQADGQLQLLAAKSTSEQHSTNKSSSGSIGVGIGTNGLTVNASASQARGKADGNDVTWTNTQVEAGNKVTLESGTDTTLKGAVVKANQVVANVGTSGAGDLKIASLQDTSVYDSKQSSSGFSVSVPIGAGVGGASVSASKTTINSNYASVTEQSGIQAGDGGFQVNVKGNTDLKGAVIASTDKAVLDGRNTFATTGALTTSDIQNSASYNATSMGGTVGVGSMASSSSVGFGSDSGKASSTTKAGISGIAGDTTVRTGDAQTGIGKIFDAEKVQKDVNAQVAITQAFGQQAPRAVANYAKSQADNLKAQAGKESDPIKQAALKTEAARWEEGGVYRVALHTVLGGLSGGVGGALGAGAVASAAPLIDDLQTKVQGALIQVGLKPSMAAMASQLVAQGTAAGIGTVAGGGSSAGAATAFNVDANNRQLHLSESVKLARLKAGKTPEEQARLNDALCALTHCSAGVPDSDPNKKQLVAMENRGANYVVEQTQLKQTGTFEGYSKTDATNDFLLKYDEAYKRTKGGVQLVGGSLGTVSGGALTAGSAPVCLATGVGCVVTGLGVAGATLSYGLAQEGSQSLLSDYQSTEGQRVLNSFSPTTYPGERNRLTEVGTDVGIVGLQVGFGALVGKLTGASAAGIVRQESTSAKAIAANGGVSTPYGTAIQSTDAAAMAARTQVENGATLYRVGTLGKSGAAEAQFWALEHPSTPGFAQRYGIPAENVQNLNFFEAATLNPGTSFITRPAPGVGANNGGVIEVVVPPGGIQMKWFSAQ